MLKQLKTILLTAVFTFLTACGFQFQNGGLHSACVANPYA